MKMAFLKVFFNHFFLLLAFPQMCVTAIANLLQSCQKDSDHKIFFDKDKDIIPFIDCHWESMTTMPRRVTQSWHATVS